MKQLLSISLSILFLFIAAGYYLIFLAADYNAKNEIAQQIQSHRNSEQIIQLSFSREELQKEIHFTNVLQNEFIYQGNHYDVVKSLSSGNEISFFCVADKKETSLFAQFKKQTTDSSPSNSSGKIQLKQVDWMFQSLNKEISLSHTVCLPANFISIIPFSQEEILSPPPKC